MRPEAGHSMMASRSSTPRRATRTIRRAPPDQRTGRPQGARRTRMQRNRTSRLESRATALYLNRPTCNGRRRWPCRSCRERKRRARTRDGADKEDLGAPSCGRSQTLLHNELRPHQALADRPPMAVWREAVAGAKAVDMMDNASAMPTAAEADAASRCVIESNPERSRPQPRNRFKRSRCAGPLQPISSTSPTRSG
jgi:hypothetical protein